MTSSAKEALSMAAAMCEASLRVMIVTEWAGTTRILPDRHLLRRFEGHDRLAVVEDRAQLVRARLREVALRLDHDRGRARARRHLALSGGEPPLGQIACRSARLHALLVGHHLPRALTDLGFPLELLVADLRLRLRVLQARARERHLRLAPADRITHVQAGGP